MSKNDAYTLIHQARDRLGEPLRVHYDHSSLFARYGDCEPEDLDSFLSESGAKITQSLDIPDKRGIHQVRVGSLSGVMFHAEIQTMAYGSCECSLRVYGKPPEMGPGLAQRQAMFHLADSAFSMDTSIKDGLASYLANRLRANPDESAALIADLAQLVADHLRTKPLYDQLLVSKQ